MATWLRFVLKREPTEHTEDTERIRIGDGIVERWKIGIMGIFIYFLHLLPHLFPIYSAIYPAIYPATYSQVCYSRSCFIHLGFSFIS